MESQHSLEKAQIKASLPLYRKWAQEAGFSQHVIEDVLAWMQSTGSSYFDSLEIHSAIYQRYRDLGESAAKAGKRAILHSFASYQISASFAAEKPVELRLLDAIEAHQTGGPDWRDPVVAALYEIAIAVIAADSHPNLFKTPSLCAKMEDAIGALESPGEVSSPVAVINLTNLRINDQPEVIYPLGGKIVVLDWYGIEHGLTQTREGDIEILEGLVDAINAIPDLDDERNERLQGIQHDLLQRIEELRETWEVSHA